MSLDNGESMDEPSSKKRRVEIKVSFKHANRELHFDVL